MSSNKADKSKIILFVAVTIQTLVAAAILMLALPYYLWGPAPADELALKAYSDNAQAIVRLMMALWATVVCITYYFCFMRKGR